MSLLVTRQPKGNSRPVSAVAIKLYLKHGDKGILLAKRKAKTTGNTVWLKVSETIQAFIN